MTTHKPTIDEQIAQLPDNAWKLEQGLIEEQTDSTPSDDLAPWQSPTLIATNSTDKQTAIEKLVAKKIAIDKAIALEQTSA